MAEPRPLSCHRWAALFWAEGEWEPAPDSKQEVYIWHPLDADIPAHAHPSWSFGKLSFWWDSPTEKWPNGNTKQIHRDQTIHGFGMAEGTLLHLGTRESGAFYAVQSGQAIYRNGRWFVRWSGWKNTREARVANVMLLALKAENESPFGTTVEQNAETVRTLVTQVHDGANRE